MMTSLFVCTMADEYAIRRDNQGRIQSHPLFRPIHLPSLPPLPLRSRIPLKELGGLWERCKLPQRGLQESNFVHFSLKI